MVAATINQPPRVRQRIKYVRRPSVDWIEWADCKNHDPDLFYSFDLDEQHAARLICLTCPVLVECLRDVRTWPADLRNVGMVAGGQYWTARKEINRKKDQT